MSLTLADVTKALGADAETYTADVIGAVLAAERAAQASATRHTGNRPAKLDEALLARVLHNLAETGGQPVQRVGSRAPGVRDLEGPWSRRIAAGDVDEEPSTKPRRKRSPRRGGTKATRKRTAASTTKRAATAQTVEE